METVHRVRAARHSGLEKLLGCWQSRDPNALALLLERLNSRVAHVRLIRHDPFTSDHMKVLPRPNRYPS
jgi:hypothetical protein